MFAHDAHVAPNYQIRFVPLRSSWTAVTSDEADNERPIITVAGQKQMPNQVLYVAGTLLQSSRGAFAKRGKSAAAYGDQTRAHVRGCIHVVRDGRPELISARAESTHRRIHGSTTYVRRTLARYCT